MKEVKLEEITLVFSNKKKLVLVREKKLEKFFQKIERICQTSGSGKFWDFLIKGDDEKK